MGKTSISSSVVAKILVLAVEPLLTEADKPKLYENVLAVIKNKEFGWRDIPDKLFDWMVLRATCEESAKELEKKLLKG